MKNKKHKKGGSEEGGEVKIVVVLFWNIAKNRSIFFSDEVLADNNDNEDGGISYRHITNEQGRLSRWA